MVKTRGGNDTQPQNAAQLCSAAHNAEAQESPYVSTTPLEAKTCEAARHPSTLNVEAALARVGVQLDSSCACEQRYLWQVFVAYAEYRKALENGDDTTEEWAWLDYCMSVFLFHYSRGAKLTLPYLAAMEATTRERWKENGIAVRDHCDMLALQEEAGCSFHAVDWVTDRHVKRYDAEVLLYSPWALQFESYSVLGYNIHNGTGAVVLARRRARRTMRGILQTAGLQAGNQQHHAQVVQQLVQQNVAVLRHGSGNVRAWAGNALRLQGGSWSPNAADDPRALPWFERDAMAAAVAADDDEAAPLMIERPTEALDVVEGDGTMELEELAAPGEPGHVGVVADHLVTGVAATAPRAALALLDTSAHVFDGPYASSAGLHALPPPQLDGRVVRFFETGEPLMDALSGLGRGADASLSAVPRGRGALLSRLMSACGGGSCDTAALCFLTCSPSTALPGLRASSSEAQQPRAWGAFGGARSGAALGLVGGCSGPASTDTEPGAAVLAPSMPTVSADCLAVARAWKDLSQRDHKKKKEREAFQMKQLDDEEAPAFVGRVLGTVEKEKARSLYRTLANAIGKSDLGTADREAAVLKALHGVSAANLLIIGSLPESSDTSGGGVLVGGLSVSNDAVDATPSNGGFTDQDRKDLQWFRHSKKFTKQRLEAAYKRHGLPSWTTFHERQAARILGAHLEKLLADAADSDSEDDDSEDEDDGTRGSGADASAEEFVRVLGKYVNFDGAGDIVIGEDFLSVKLSLCVPTEVLDSEEEVAETPTRRYKASDLKSASEVLAKHFDDIVALLDVASLSALACVSHAGAAVVPFRGAGSFWIRRGSTTDAKATPSTYLSCLLPDFLPFGTANTPREERVERARELAVKMLLRANEITVKQDVGVGQTPWQIVKDAAANSRFSFVEFHQLHKAVNERDELFQDYQASDVGCTVNTNIDRALTKKLLDQYLRRLLRDETKKKELETVVSRPYARGAAAGVTLETSLSTFLVLSKKRREYFMDLNKKSKSGSYGNARVHSSPAAIKIIREATEKIGTTLEELSKDFPARRDAAVKYLLSLPDFQPTTDSEREQVAAWRSWLSNSLHI
jgi:hypothetical protein